MYNKFNPIENPPHKVIGTKWWDMCAVSYNVVGTKPVLVANLHTVPIFILK